MRDVIRILADDGWYLVVIKDESLKSSDERVRAHYLDSLKKGVGFLESLPLPQSVHNWRNPKLENQWRRNLGLPLLPLKPQKQKFTHQEFKHTTKPGRVTVAGHLNHDLTPATLNSILKQAQLKER